MSTNKYPSYDVLHEKVVVSLECLNTQNKEFDKIKLNLEEKEELLNKILKLLHEEETIYNYMKREVHLN